MHQNIQSLGTSFSALQALVEEQHPDILTLSEHWKSYEQLHLHKVPGYTLVSSFCRDINKHGGTAIYCRNNLSYKIRNDFDHFNVDKVVELACIQVSSFRFEFLVFCFYRPNTPPEANVTIFLEKFKLVLDKCISENMSFVISGDFNIDLLTDTWQSRDFLMLIECYRAVATITQPTRVTKFSATCIDNIITDFQDSESHVINTHLSDQFAKKLIMHFTFCSQVHERV